MDDRRPKLTNEIRSWKLVFDPVLKKNGQKLYRFDGVCPGNSAYNVACVSDPRLNPKKIRNRAETPADLRIPTFKVDEHYIGKPPSTEVSFFELNDNVSVQFLTDLCKKCGEIEECKVFYHPSDGRHLGIGRVIFVKIKAAAVCVDKYNKAPIMGKLASVFLDPLGKQVKMMFQDMCLQAAHSNKQISSKVVAAPDDAKDAAGKLLDVAADVDYSAAAVEGSPSDINMLIEEYDTAPLITPPPAALSSGGNAPIEATGPSVPTVGSAPSSSSATTIPEDPINRQRQPSKEITQLAVEKNVAELKKVVSDDILGRVIENMAFRLVENWWASHETISLLLRPKINQPVQFVNGLSLATNRPGQKPPYGPPQRGASFAPPNSSFNNTFSVQNNRPNENRYNCSHNGSSSADYSSIFGAGFRASLQKLPSFKRKTVEQSVQPPVAVDGSQQRRRGPRSPSATPPPSRSRSPSRSPSPSTSSSRSSSPSHHNGVLGASTSSSASSDVSDVEISQRRRATSRVDGVKIRTPATLTSSDESLLSSDDDDNVRNLTSKDSETKKKSPKKSILPPTTKHPQADVDVKVDKWSSGVAYHAKKTSPISDDGCVATKKSTKIAKKSTVAQSTSKKSKIKDDKRHDSDYVDDDEDSASSMTSSDDDEAPLPPPTKPAVKRGRGRPKNSTVCREIKSTCKDRRNSHVKASDDEAPEEEVSDEESSDLNSDLENCDKIVESSFETDTAYLSPDTDFDEGVKKIVDRSDEKIASSSANQPAINGTKSLLVSPPNPSCSIGPLIRPTDAMCVEPGGPYDAKRYDHCYFMVKPLMVNQKSTQVPGRTSNDTPKSLKNSQFSPAIAPKLLECKTAAVNLTKLDENLIRTAQKSTKTSEKSRKRKNVATDELDFSQHRENLPPANAEGFWPHKYHKKTKPQQTHKPSVVFKARDAWRETEILYKFCVDGLDEEDISLLKIAYDQLVMENSTVNDWLTGTHWEPHVPTCLPQSIVHQKMWRSAEMREDTPRLHFSGSARTEGFYKQTPKVKRGFLATARQATSFEQLPSTLQISEYAAKQQVQLSREARSNQRRLLNVMGDVESDFLKFNQLKFRKKCIRFSRSAIHGWGLFALAPIGPDEMVVEYVGEKVRLMVAEKREKTYEKMGIGSSYLFRLDNDWAIDATKQGAVARFINHSCNPSCYAKIISLDGEKRIVIYSKQNITKGEEITYDYKFPIEDVKIPCNCGAYNCRGSLN